VAKRKPQPPTKPPRVPLRCVRCGFPYAAPAGTECPNCGPELRMLAAQQQQERRSKRPARRKQANR
jgi:rRNA maturation endonuclease Nob1